jgi:phosphate uptake regulator
MGLKDPSDCLSYRATVKSIERIADHACGIADRALKLKDKLPKDYIHKVEKMSQLSLAVLNDAVEALLRRDYHLADKTVDAVENMHVLESDATAALEMQKLHDPASIKLILEDIRRTAEYASDIAEAAMNQTIDEVVEKHMSAKRKANG